MQRGLLVQLSILESESSFSKATWQHMLKIAHPMRDQPMLNRTPTIMPMSIYSNYSLEKPILEKEVTTRMLNCQS